MAIILILARLAFLTINIGSFAESSKTEIVDAFLRGFRFDAATILLSITVPLLPLWIPAPSSVRRWLAVLSCSLIVLIIISAGIVLAGDIFFFGESSRHVTFEPIDMLGDLRPMAKTLLDGYLWAAALACAVLGGAVWLTIRLYRASAAADAWRGGWDWKRLYWLLPVLLVTVIGARGGFQKEPLKSADAVVGKSTILGNIVLNGWYSFLTAAVKAKRPDQFMAEAEAVAEMRRMIDPHARYQSDEFPLFRTMTPNAPIAAPGERINVVLIIVESLNAEYLQAFGGRVKIMPFLDSLARESLIFTNFHSIGTRSFRGVTAILASYPNLSVDSYRLTFLLPKMQGLGEILSENGYSVRFMHAAAENSMGITAICAMAGYEDFVSEEDFPKGRTNGSWGIWDHLAFERLTEDMDAMAEPFHYGLFTLCTHAPWTLPDGFMAPFAPETVNGEIYNTFAYLDNALREFFDRESQRERFGRTLYVLVGDHTTHTGESERFHIGSIFYAPGRIAPRSDDRLADQLDMTPTVLDLSGIVSAFSAFGTSLLCPSDSMQWSIHYQSNQLNYRQGDRVLVSTITHNLGLYNVDFPDMSGGGLLAAEKSTADEMTFRMKVIYQVAEMLMKQNRIAPGQ